MLTKWGMEQKNLALIAHDSKKEALAQWVVDHLSILEQHSVFCTATTAGVIKQRCPNMQITATKSGPLGGDQQVGAMIAEGQIDGLVFFIDPLSPHPHDVDVKALSRLATVYDIPMAYSRATADLIVASGFLGVKA